MTARTITASEFKAKCLKLMDEVNESGDSLTVVKRGKPVVEVRPANSRRRTLLGLHRGQGKILGDIISPVSDDWEAQGK